MVSLSLSNKFLNLHNGLWVIVLLLFSSPCVSQNYFNKRFDFEGASQSNIGVIYENEKGIYTLGWGMKNSIAPFKFGVIFSKVESDGEALSFSYFNRDQLNYIMNLQEVLFIKNDELNVFTRGTLSSEAGTYNLVHDFKSGLTDIKNIFRNDDIDSDPLQSPTIYSGTENIDGTKWFASSYIRNDTLRSSLIRIESDKIVSLEIDSVKFNRIRSDEEGFLYTIGAEAPCPKRDCAVLYLNKFDQDGQLVTGAKFSESLNIAVIHDVLLDKNENLVILGSHVADETNINGNLKFFPSIIILNKEFELIDQEIFEVDDFYDTRFEDITESRDRSGYVLSGRKNLIPNSGNSISDGYAMKMNYNLDTIWERSYNNVVNGSHMFYDVTSSIDGGYILGGKVSYNEIVEDEQPVQGWLVKVNSQGLFTPEFTSTSEEIKNNYNKVNIYPNPSHGSIVIEELDTPPINYTITNSSGQEIYRLESTGGNITHFVDMEVYSGIYYVQIWSEGNILDTRKIIIRTR